MNTMNWRPFRGYDAAGRPYDPTRSVYYTATDVLGMFSDAVARGEPSNAEIKAYYRETPEWGTCAFIRNKVTGEITLYRMDVITATPYPIHTPPGETPPRPKRRRQFSREWKLLEAERKWKER